MATRSVNEHPQGTQKKEQLLEQFQYDAPFYLKENKPVFNRRTNQQNYDSALELARGRFEEKLKEEKDSNARNIDEYQTYMDETMKYQELRQLKEAQNRLIVKSVLEQQIEQERRKKMTSKQQRRQNLGGDVTFGPRETNDTVAFQALKKQQDVAKIREELQT